MSLKPPPDPDLDRDLVAAVDRGESAAFEQLYFRYRDCVASLALRQYS